MPPTRRTPGLGGGGAMASELSFDFDGFAAREIGRGVALRGGALAAAAGAGFLAGAAFTAAFFAGALAAALLVLALRAGAFLVVAAFLAGAFFEVVPEEAATFFFLVAVAAFFLVVAFFFAVVFFVDFSDAAVTCVLRSPIPPRARFTVAEVVGGPYAPD